MKYVFYADIFIMINFIMDFIVLKITGSILKKTPFTTSYLLGAIIGSISLTFNIIYPIKNSIINMIISYFIISFVMCIVTFGIKNRKEIVKNMVTLYIVSFLCGGIANAIYYFTEFQMMMKNSPFVRFLIISGCSYFIMSEIVKEIKLRTGRTGEKSDIIKVEICHQKKVEQIFALFDSGNSLREPISGKPVHIVDYETADKILKGGKETEEKIRVVPFHSIGNSNGLITAFLCDNLRINIKGDYIDLGSSYIGIYRGKLSVDGHYNMILNRSINKWL